MIYQNGKIQKIVFVKNDINILNNIYKLQKLKKPMFFFQLFT
jgi:hypothetical protein